MIRILLFAAALQAAAPNTDATGPMQAAARTPHDAERIVATLATPRALLQLEAMTRAGREEPVVESGETLHRRVEPAADATIGELAAGAGQDAGNASRPHRGSELRARAATWIAYTRAASVAAADGAMRMAASGAATVRPMVHNAGALIRRGTTAPAAPMVAGGAAAALCIALAAIVIVRRRRARAADTATASVREARALVRHGIATVEVARRTGLPRDAAALLELRRRPDTAPSRTQRRVAPAVIAAGTTVQHRREVTIRPPVISTNRPTTQRVAAPDRRRPHLELELAPTRTGARHRFTLEGRIA